jgi:hypothetical protein
LAAVARQSLLLAIQGTEAREGLQRRWGEVSCQRAFLNQAEDILTKAADDPNQNTDPDRELPDHIMVRIVLGGMTFGVLLADENAKLNLNFIYRQRNPDEVRRVVRDSVEAGSRLEVRLVPSRTRSADEPVFDSWGQVFACNRAAEDPPVAQQLIYATKHTTCWGDGRLNVLRTPEWRIRRLGQNLVSPESLDRLLEWRRKYFAQRQALRRRAATGQQTAAANESNPAAPASTNVTDFQYSTVLGQTPPQRGKVRQIGELVTSRSTCHSLWLTVTQGERSWSSCTIRYLADGTGPVYTRVVWQ